jgi:hypothetical protein
MMEGVAAFAKIGIAFCCALFLSTVVRTTTIELTQTLGTVWPFSLAHCHLPLAVGCQPRDQVVLSASGKRYDLYWPR